MGKKESKQTDALEVFRSAPIPVAVLKNALPAMAASLMVLIYNLADTFFIGQTHNALMVAAVSLATPVFLIFMSLGTIFGIGGTSVISRAMGEGRMEYGKKVCSFCMWGCVAASLLMMIVVFAFMTPILTTVVPVRTHGDTPRHIFPSYPFPDLPFCFLPVIPIFCVRREGPVWP